MPCPFGTMPVQARYRSPLQRGDVRAAIFVHMTHKEPQKGSEGKSRSETGHRQKKGGADRNPPHPRDALPAVFVEIAGKRPFHPMPGIAGGVFGADRKSVV